MTLEQFLAWALTSGGAGTLTFGTIQLFDKLFGGIPSRVKFYGAMALSLVIPALAFGLAVLLGVVTFSWEGVFSVAAVAYAVSQTVHYEAAEAGKA